MLSKIVSLACVALSAGQHVSIVGSPEWQAFKNAELAHIAPSVGPLAAAGGNYAQEQLNWLAQQQAIVAAGAGRRKRQVQVVGSLNGRHTRTQNLPILPHPLVLLLLLVGTGTRSN